MLPIGGDEPTAKKKAKEFVEKISENTSPIRLESIQFCHTETAKLEVEEVAKDGYCIVPIENLPWSLLKMILTVYSKHSRTI